MYGIPVDLNLSNFNGATLLQIVIGQNQIKFNFDSDASILVEGSWQLKDTNNDVIDHNYDNPDERQNYCVHSIIGKKIATYNIDLPSSFSLEFENRYVLKIFDDSKQYESVAIQPGNIFI